MATLLFSIRAKADLADIVSCTIRVWGEDQAVRCLDGIDACYERIARNPSIGRVCGNIRSELRRVEQGRHVVFYRRIDDGIWVSRILHRGMLPERHDLDDDTPDLLY